MAAAPSRRELHPGFRCPTLSHHTPLSSDVARDMELARHGLEVLRPDVETFAPSLDGPPLVVLPRSRDSRPKRCGS